MSYVPEKPFFRIPLPTQRQIGLGDVVKRVTQAFGIKPCKPCEKRAALLNRWVRFGGRLR